MTSSVSVQAPPHERDAEQAVLGGMLFDQRIAVDCLQALKADDFYDEGHREIFKVLGEMSADGIPIDLITTSHELRERGLYEKVGGVIYLDELDNCCPIIAHHSHWCRIVIEMKKRRDLLKAASNLYHDAGDAEDIILRHQARINKLTETRENSLIHVGAAADQVMELLDQRHRSGDSLLGPSTGLKSLDKYMLGLIPGKLIIIGARPAMGKSALAIQLAEQAATLGQNTIIFSLEMNADEIVQRQLARRCCINLKDLMLARDWDKNAAAVAKERGFLSTLPMRIDDNSRTIEQIEAISRREHSRGRLDLIVIDYIQHIHTEQKHASMHGEVTAISRACADLAHNLGITVIALSQLGRDVERREPPIPRLSDLKESGSLEQDADVVAMLYQPEFYLKQKYPEPPTDTAKLEKYEADLARCENLTIVLFPKIRYNQTGVVRLNFFGDTQIFTQRADHFAGAP